MIRSELIAGIAVQNPHLYARDVERVVTAILDRMADALADGGRVELRDFRMFTVTDRKARTGRNPRSGQSVAVAAKRDVRFKPSKGMRARLNLDWVEPEEEAARLQQAS